MSREMRIEDRGSRVGATVSRLVISVFCFLFSVSCYAEELPDPTRPPASIGTPIAAIGAESAPAGLQSIIISKNRRAAIIDGETIELGGKHGDAKLIAVNEGSVVLQGTQGRQVLTLFPDVKMTRVASTAKAKSTGKNALKTGKKQRADEKAKATLQTPESKPQPEQQVNEAAHKENK